MGVLFSSGRKVVSFAWNAGNNVACLGEFLGPLVPPMSVHPSIHAINTYLTLSFTLFISFRVLVIS